MWNNNGFALAADSNQTVAAKNQTWVDSVEKIISIPGHQIAFGASGRASLEGVEVNEIIRSWSKSLPTTPFRTFDDYVIDFLVFFAKTKLPGAGSVDISNLEFMRKEAETLRKDYDEFSRDLMSVRSDWVESLKHNAWNLNLYGPNWEELINTLDYSDSITETTRTKIERLERIRTRVFEKLSESDFRLYLENTMDSYIREIAEDVFPEFFTPAYDEQSVYAISEILGMNILNRFNFDAPINFIFAGYGEDDWIPSAVKFKVTSRTYGIPKIAIENIATPLSDWFLSLAVETGVNSLTRGYDDDSHAELMGILKPHIKKNHETKIQDAMRSSGQERFINAMGKIDALTLNRLEYVARLFVQIEALQSYLNEPVPGVGGDTRVISMTKTTRYEKLIPEMS